MAVPIKKPREDGQGADMVPRYGTFPAASLDPVEVAYTMFLMVGTAAQMGHVNIRHTFLDYVTREELPPAGKLVYDLFMLSPQEVNDKWFQGRAGELAVEGFDELFRAA